MAKGKESPKSRRKSIAVPTSAQKKPIFQRKRPHSIAPGDTVLSPRALARRVLKPRKSILKSTINVVDGDDFTQTLDFTQDYRSGPRKSLGRRVSFAQHAYVKVFERDIRQPSSSPTKEGSSPQQEEQQDPPRVNDENDYPGAKPPSHRRVSASRRSLGEAGEMASSDMDLDFGADGPSAFIGQSEDDFGVGDYDNEVWDDDEDEFDDGEDMEVTEVIANNIRRRSSARRSSLARQPLAEQPPQEPSQSSQDVDVSNVSYEEEASGQSLPSYSGEGDENNTQSFVSEEGASGTSEPMEYTVPLAQPVRGKRPPSDAFLALRAMTHNPENSLEEEFPSSDDGDLYVRKEGSGEGGGLDGKYWDERESEELEPEMEGSDAMELTDAIQRLQVVRESLGGGEVVGGGTQSQEEWVPEDDDAFSSDVEGGEGDGDLGDQTLNLTGLLRRASMGEVDIGMSADAEEREEPAAGKENEQPERVREASDAIFKPPTTGAGKIFSAPSPFKPSRSTSSPATVTVPSKSFVFSKPFPTPSATPEPEPRPPPASTSASAPPPSTPKPPPRTPGSPGKSKIPVPHSASRTAAQHPPTSATKPTTPKYTAAFAPPSARKLPRARSSENLQTVDEEDRPSPAKKLKVPVFQSPGRVSASPARAVGKLSPSKKARFESPNPQRADGSQADPPAAAASGDGEAGRRASVGAGMRRPPGWLAQRRSMGAGRISMGVAVEPSAQESQVERPALPAPRDASPATRASPVAVSVESHAYPPSIYPTLPGNRQGSPAVGDRASAKPASPGPGSLYPPLPRDSPASRAKDSPVSLPQGSPAREEQPEIVDVTYGEDDMLGNPTEAWVKDVQDAGSFEEDDEPPISIEQFFSMTGIKFMDELTVPRRSNFHRAGFTPRGRRDSATSEAGGDSETASAIPLAEYIVAMAVDLPQLELYSHVARDLQMWIQHSKENFKQAEVECAKVTPELFREYSRCSEEDRPDFQQSLKLIKSHAHDQAKSKWYEWKLEWIKQLQESADEGFDDLEGDAKVLESLTRQVQDILPSLREEYENAIKELEQEQAEVDELERSDQSQLNVLKANIAEQELALESYRTEISENKAKVTNLEEKLEEIEQQKKESLQAIADAERMALVQKNSTKAEVFKLRDELESIQSLHFWRASKLGPDLVELIYDSRYLVSIPCTKFRPRTKDLIVTRLTDPSTRRRDDFPKLTEYSFKVGMHQVMTDKMVNVRQIAHRLSDTWAACAQLRQQLTFVGIKFPTTVFIGPNEGDKPPELNVVATILYPGKRAKALVKFVLNVDTFASWPSNVASLECSVEVAYGSIESAPVLEAVRGRLAKATQADNHGCLLDACILGLEQYD